MHFRYTTKETTTILIMRIKLTACNRAELHILHRKVMDALARSDPGTATRRNAIASLENIEVEIASRCP